MDTKTVVIIVVIVAAVLALPLLASLGAARNAEQTASSATTQAPATAKSSPSPSPAPQPAPAPPQTSAESIMSVAGTAWSITHPQYGNITVQFMADGSLSAQSDKVAMQIQGSWRQSGANVSISTPMASLSAQVQGNQLIADGQPARRLQ